MKIEVDEEITHDGETYIYDRMMAVSHSSSSGGGEATAMHAAIYKLKPWEPKEREMVWACTLHDPPITVVYSPLWRRRFNLGLIFKLDDKAGAEAMQAEMFEWIEETAR